MFQKRVNLLIAVITLPVILLFVYVGSSLAKPDSPTAVLDIAAVDAVSVDGAVSTGTADDSETISFNHTTGTGANRLTLVGVSWNTYNAASGIVSVTFTPDGGEAVDLTEVIFETYSSDYRYAAIYGLVGPTSGQAGTIDVTFIGPVNFGSVAGAVNFAGVNQSDPYGPTNGNSASSTTPGVLLEGLNGDELVFDVVFYGGQSPVPALTVNASQTEMWNTTIANTRGAASIEQATSSSVNMDWSTGTSGIWVSAAVALNPAATGPDETPPEITLLGDAEMTVYQGNPFTDPGATASDNVDGDITGDIVVGGDTVDTNTLDDYVITYDVQDAAGNPAPQVTRTVHVVEAPNVMPITLDGQVSTAMEDGGTSIDIPHTTGSGANRLLMVGISINNYSTGGTAPVVDVAQFNYDTTELTLTPIGELNYGGRFVQIFGLVDPPSNQAGTVHIVFTTSMSYGIVGGAANFAGVDLTTPWGTAATASGQSTTPAVEVPGLNGYEVVFDTIFLGGATIPTPTYATGQTQLWSETGNRVGGAASTRAAEPTSVTMSWDTGSTTVYWVIVAVPINPAPAGTTYDLTMESDGNGSTTPSVGVHAYPEDDVVAISATPNLGYEFDAWTGNPDCADGSVTMDADKTCTATFKVKNFNLTMSNDGNGTTVPDTGVHPYQEGSVVAISATPATGYKFYAWTGSSDCADNSVTMDGDKACHATFIEDVPVAEVTVDGEPSSGTANDAASITFAHTTGTGTNRLLLVGVSWNSGSTAQPITAVTFTPEGEEAITLDEVITEQATSTTAPRNSAIYSLLAPPSGVIGDVTVAFNGDVPNGIVAGAANFAGVNQADPLGTPGGGTASNSAAATVTLSGLSGTELVFDNLFQGASGESQTITAATGQTEQWNAWIGNTRGGASAKPAADETEVTMNWTAGSGSVWVITAVPINPAPLEPEDILGDLNGDGKVNSGDALIVLSCDVGIDTTAFCPCNCGDVNDDGAVNSSDALIILSYDVGMTVSLPVGEPGCPSDVTPCLGCNPTGQ